MVESSGAGRSCTAEKHKRKKRRGRRVLEVEEEEKQRRRSSSEATKVQSSVVVVVVASLSICMHPNALDRVIAVMDSSSASGGLMHDLKLQDESRQLAGAPLLVRWRSDDGGFCVLGCCCFS